MNGLIPYLCVSAADKGRSDIGIEAQRAAISNFAAAEGFELLDEYIEVEINKDADALDHRPVLRKALAKARKTSAAIGVAALDRLSHDVAFISRLMSRKVMFVICESGTGTYPFMLHLYSALVQKKRSLISVRTRAALAAARERGVKLGNPTNLAEAQRLATAASSAAAEAFARNVLPVVRGIQRGAITTHAGIARALNQRGVETARGGIWYATTVRNLLRRSNN